MALIKQTPTVILPFGIGNNRNAETLFRRIQDKTGMATYPFVRGGVGFGVKNVVDDTNRLVAVGANKPAVQFEDGVNKGLWIEPASINRALNRRKMITTWTPTSVTVGDAVGWDGVTDAGTLLTATGANGIIFQSFTGASAQRTYSVALRRVTGTGTIEITADGATWEDVTASLRTDKYVRVDVTATALNPDFGIRIGTSGDVIRADFNQFEDGAVATSPINIADQTAVATRPADVATITDASELIGQTEGTILFECDLRQFNGGFRRLITIRSGTSPTEVSGILLDNLSSLVFIRGETIPLTSPTYPAGRQKYGIKYKSGDIKVYRNGELIGSSAATLPQTVTLNTFSLGYDNAGSGQEWLNDFISIPIILKQALSDTEVQNWTTL